MKLKIFALVLLLAMTAGMLVACKGGNEDGPGTTVDATNDAWYDAVWWDDATFVFRLQENSNNQELPSTCARYLAGDNELGIPKGERADNIDDMVDIRNAEATATTKVTPIYTYIMDEEPKGWSQNIDDMVYDMTNFVDGLTPDAYCNFVYDMVNASLQGAFANLKTSTLQTTGQQDGQKGNFFRFTDPRFVDSGEGYMVQYMRSLSLSRNKQYCLSSDYFTDMIRAFFVVPVNINLLSSFSADGEYGDFNYDYVEDGKYTIEDFYQYVYDYKWTYNTLAEISASGFYAEGQEASPTGDPNGCLYDKLIWAMSESSGLSASGMLYTTSVTVIEREPATLTDGYGNTYDDYVYYYPTDNQDLYDFCDALTSLMSENKGIISITNSQDCSFSPGDPDALLAIRNRFVNGSILFGGDICLGSLEYSEYTNMEGGFGIVPVPLFRTEHEETDSKGNTYTVKDTYQTQIHNLGRIGAINAKTKKFAMISAYLDYQSMYSTDILNEYYETRLCGDVLGGGEGAKMLNYIRKDVRTSFDKAFEDAIGYLFATGEGGDGAQGEGTSSEKQKWHSIIKDGQFEVDAGEMRNAYATYVGGGDSADGGTAGKNTKPGRLNSLESSYIGLPT